MKGSFGFCWRKEIALPQKVELSGIAANSFLQFVAITDDRDVGAATIAKVPQDDSLEKKRVEGIGQCQHSGVSVFAAKDTWFHASPPCRVKTS